MRHFLAYCAISLLLLASCQSPGPDQIEMIEGYWNIEEVKLSDGSTRAFPFTNHLDHFDIHGSKGVKSRVSPTYDGGFINYGSPVPFQWKMQEDQLILVFNDGAQSYQQTLASVSEESLVLLHENGTQYTYTKFELNEEQ